MNNDQQPANQIAARFAPEERQRRLYMRRGGFLIMTAGTLIGLIGAIGSSRQIASLNDIEPLLGAVLGVVMAVYFFVGGAAIFVTGADILLDSRSGLTIRYGKLGGKKLPVSSLRLTHRVQARVSEAHAASRLFNQKAKAFEIPGLPVFHRLAGLYYRVGFKPVLIVTEMHENHELLIAELSQAAEISK